MSPSKTERVKSWLTKNERNIINNLSLLNKDMEFFFGGGVTRPDNGVDIFGVQLLAQYWVYVSTFYYIDMTKLPIVN